MREFTAETSDGVTLRARATLPRHRVRLVVGHGNGLAIDAYRSFWEPLAEQFDLVAFDLRNHGRSGTTPLANHTISRTADDLEAVWSAAASELGPQPSVAVVHSLSALGAVLHQAQRARWDALVLVDPPLAPPPGHPLHETHVREVALLAAGARRRRATFASPAELAARLGASAPFRRVGTVQLAELAGAIVHPIAADAWELTCPPRYEAQIFESNTRPDAWLALAAIQSPTLVVGADPAVEGGLSTAAMSAAAAQEHGLRYERIPGTTHFLQLERPDAARAAVAAFVDEAFRSPSR